MADAPRKIGSQEIKEALWNIDFREKLPDLRDDIKKYFVYPNCGKCFSDLYEKISSRLDVLKDYFGEEVEVELLSTADVPAKTGKGGVDERGLSERVAHRRPRRLQTNKRRRKLAVEYTRVFRSFQTSSIEEDLKNYPPSKFIVEAMTQSGDMINIIFLTTEKPAEEDSADESTRTPT